MLKEKQQLLIVDDETSIRKLVMAKLSADGYRCVEASNAQQALEILGKEVVCLVLLDVKMPGKSGLEFLPEIKAKFPDTAVVMATAVADVTTAIECMQHGAYDYITKPFDLNDILHSVRRALEKRRLEIENREYHERLQEKVAEQAGRIRASFFNSIRSLNNALEARDKYTSGHSQRVTDLAAGITRQMAIPPEATDTIILASLVHDIGKIGVKEDIINKPSCLNNEELQDIKKHPEIGERILSPVAADEEILKLVRHHHERFDGTGYPDKLAGEQIPLGARILAVADSFEAMTSERPYRKAMSRHEACNELARCKGTQFDPEIVDCLLKIEGEEHPDGQQSNPKG